MRIYPLLLAAAATVSSYADADASLTRSSSPFERPKPSHQHEPQRYLRDGAEATEEERTSSPKFLEILNDMAIASSEIYRTTFIQKYGDLPADKTFASFQLGKAGDNLLKDPQFFWWARIMIHQNEVDPEVAIAELLRSHYTDDRLLAVLEKSTHDETTKDLAISLQDGWIISKIKAGNPTDEVTKHVLKLINIDYDAPSTSRFKAWVMLRKQRPKNSDEEMAMELANHYGDSRFLEMLEILSKIQPRKTSRPD